MIIVHVTHFVFKVRTILCIVNEAHCVLYGLWCVTIVISSCKKWFKCSSVWFMFYFKTKSRTESVFHIVQVWMCWLRINRFYINPRIVSGQQFPLILCGFYLDSMWKKSPNWYWFSVTFHFTTSCPLCYSCFL